MSGDGEDPYSQGTPPSFIPSSSQRRRQSAAQHIPQAGEQPHVNDPAGSTPPSFTPSAADHAARGPQDAARVHMPSAAPSHTAAVAHTPLSSRTSRSTSHTQQAAVSARPDGSTRLQQAATAPRRASGSSAHAGAAREAGSGRYGRGTTGTSESALRPGRSTGARDASSTPGHPGRPLGHGQPVRAVKRHRPLRTVLIVILVLIVALLLAFAGAWNWVDSNLNKSSWLTGSADTAGTSWLILGSDQRDEDGGVGGSAKETPGARNDTILVLTRASNGRGSLISIPRDSLVKVSGQYMKINAVSQLDGHQALVGQVEKITGEHIDHVAQIRFDGLQQVVDALDGVELCYDADVNDARSGLVWTKGCHQANGSTALAFSRMRYSDPEGDFGRAQRQRQVIAAIIKKAATPAVLANPGKLHSVAEASLDSIVVDEKANPYTLAMMALTMRAASGDDGVTGSVYWTDPGYYVRGVGSSVLLDDEKNLALFNELMDGSHAAGAVGTLAETK